MTHNYNDFKAGDGTEYDKFLAIPNTWVHHVMFCVGYECNFDCPYCINKMIRKEVKDMSRVDMKNLEAFYSQPFDISVDGFGEPLIHMDKLKYISDHLPDNALIRVLSNGSLINNMKDLFTYSNKFRIKRSCSEKPDVGDNEHSTKLLDFQHPYIKDLIIGDTPEVIQKYKNNRDIVTSFLSKVDMSGTETSHEVLRLLNETGINDNYWINNSDLYLIGLSDCMDTICVSCMCSAWKVFELPHMNTLRKLSMYQDEVYFNKSKCIAQLRINDTSKEFDEFFNQPQYVGFRQRVKDFYAAVFCMPTDFDSQYCDLICDCSVKWNVALKPLNKNLIYDRLDGLYDKYLRSFGVMNHHEYTYSRVLVKDSKVICCVDFKDYKRENFEDNQYIIVRFDMTSEFDVVVVGENREFYKVFSHPGEYRLYSKIHDKLFKYLLHTMRAND